MYFCSGQLMHFCSGVDKGYAPCLIPRHKIRSRPASRLTFVASVSERVPVVVLHNEARAVVIDRPRWPEAAAGHRLRP